MAKDPFGFVETSASASYRKVLAKNRSFLKMEHCIKHKAPGHPLGVRGPKSLAILLRDGCSRVPINQ
jgi:hypothetical protein